MNFKLIIEPEAEADLDAAFKWHEDQRAGLGQQFLFAVDAAFAAIERGIQRHSDW